jgi:xylulokinase
MPATACFLGLDIARNGLGLVLINADGEVAATLRRSYGTTNGQTSDPQDWWRAVRTGVKEILRRCHRQANHIRSIGLTGDSQGIVALDADGKVLCPTTLGPDPRVVPYAESLTKTVGARNLLNLASGAANDRCAASKLLWLRDHEKRVWHDLAHVLPPKDFIRYRLCHTLVSDASDAAATILFNPKTRTWSKQLLGQIDINPAWLPSISNAQLISGRVTAEAARETGLVAGTPVVTGAGHVAAAAISVGVLHPGSALIELGGEGSLFVPTAEPIRDPQSRLQSTCHALPGTWALVAPNLASGHSLDWLLEHVATAEVMQSRRTKRDPLDVLAELASEVPPGSDGLLFLSPGREGEQSGFLGLKYEHRRGHLIRAVLEGGALAVRQTLDVITELKQKPDKLFVTGAGATNTLWCQILADALDHPIIAMPGDECDLIGAAMLASSAVGIHKTIDEACAQMIKHGQTYSPRKAATHSYSALLPGLERLRTSLSSAILPAAMEAAK